MVTVEQLTELMQAGGQRFVFGRPQKEEILTYLHPDEEATAFNRIKEFSSIPAGSLRKQGLFVLVTSQRMIFIALNNGGGWKKTWAELYFAPIDLQQVASCAPLEKERLFATMNFVLVDGSEGYIVGWKKSMPQVHDAVATAISGREFSPHPRIVGITPATSEADARQIGEGADPPLTSNQKPNTSRSSSGRWRSAFHFCFMTIPGLLTIAVCVIAAVLLPGPTKMIPVVVLGGVLAQRTNG